MTGLELIAAERKRQIEQEGWTAEHDLQHDEEELAWAACYYAMPSSIFEAHTDVTPADMFRETGWCDEYAKRGKKTRKQQLVIAGALIAAEIDRLLAEEAAESYWRDYIGEVAK